MLDDVAASGCPPIRYWTLEVHSVRLTGNPPPLEGGAEACCPRRTALDDILVRAARQAGADVRLEFAVRDVLTEDGRVVGIRGGRPGALDDGLSGRRLLDDALADYERLRNEAAMPACEMNSQMASLRGPSTRTHELYRELRQNQAAANRFMGALMGSVPIREFFPKDRSGRS